MDAANDPFLRHDHGIDEERRLNIRSTVACADGGCGLSDPEDIVKRKAMTRKLVTAIVVCIIFMLVEVGGGIYAGSLAILTDAAHLLSDVASFAISLFAIYASGWDATPKQSYGFHRVEILGALVSIHIIWLITGILVYEAISRFIHQSQPVKGKIMFIIAAMGLIVNIGMMLILGEHGHGHSHGGHGHSHGGHAHSHRGHADSHNGDNHAHHHSEHQQHDHAHEHGNSFHLKIDDHHGSSLKLDTDIEDIRPKKDSNNVNVKGAYLHVLGDLIQSIGVMFAGALIWYNPNWKVADLICTLFFSVLVLLTTVSMWRDISDVLMESTPREIDATQLEDGLKKIDKVQAVHELHIWAITLGKVLLACHVKIEHDADADEVLRKVIEYCERDFKISHVTIQIERD